MIKNINSIWRKFFSGKMHIALANHIKEGLDTFLLHAKEEAWLDEGEIRNQKIEEALSSKGDLSKLKPILTHQFHWNLDFKDAKTGELTKRRFNVMKFKSQYRFRDFNSYQIGQNNGDKKIMMINEYEKFFNAAFNIIESRHHDAHTKNEDNSRVNALNITSNIYALFDNTLFGCDEDDKKLLTANCLELTGTVYEVERENSNYDEPKTNSISSNIEQNKELNDLQYNQLLQEIKDLKDAVISIKLPINLESNNKKKHYQVVNIDYSRILNSVNDSLDLGLKNTELALVEHINSQLGDTSSDIIREVIGSLNNNNQNNSIQDVIGNEDHEDHDLDEDHEDHSIEDHREGDYLTEAEASSELSNLQWELKKLFFCKNWENIAQGPIREEIFKEKIDSYEKWIAHFSGEEFWNTDLYGRYDEHQDVMDRQFESSPGKRYLEILGKIKFIIN